MSRGQVTGARLLQVLLSFLCEAPSDHPEALLVQVSSQEVAKACVAARDVHIFISFVGNVGKLPDPTVQVEEEQKAQDVEKHDCRRTQMVWSN